MEKKYQVFVSSTYEDLKEERVATYNCLLDNNCIPVGMEQFPASPLSQWEYITKMIDTSDYYLLIVAGRYGSIDGAIGMSYTEKEFEYAQKQGIPILAFIHEHPEVISAGKTECGDEKREKLEAFRKKIKESGLLVNFYNNIDDLKYKIIRSVTRIIKDCPRVGWVRGDQVRDENKPNTQVETKREYEAFMKEDGQKITEKSLLDEVVKYSDSYQNTQLQGTFEFDYSNNNGEFVIGNGEKRFVTKWSKASNVSIHAYSDASDIVAIGRVKAPVELENANRIQCDFSSRVRTAGLGDIIIWKNQFGNYAGTKIIFIKDDTRGDDLDELICEYIVYD